MTIDLKWLIPVAAPFAVWALARLFWAFTGLPWEPSQRAAGLVLFIAPIMCVPLLIVLTDLEVCWNVRIGKRSAAEKE